MTDEQKKASEFACGTECGIVGSGAPAQWDKGHMVNGEPDRGRFVFPKGPHPLGLLVTPLGGGEAQPAVIWDHGKRVEPGEKREWWGVLTVEECVCQGEARDGWQGVCALCDGLGRFGKLHTSIEEYREARS